ncbi:MAG: hypothetical protein ACLQDY_01830 [Streptosporangiaceae bacterium]
MQPEPGVEGVVDRLDALVEPSPEPENQVLAGNARVVRWEPAS